MHPAFARIDHRPWPAPARRWTWAQTWSDLAFLHWPIPAASLRPRIPRGLTLQEREGSAWIGIVPFRMMIRPRLSPAVPGCSFFPEINVRTYVERDGAAGVWFFSLDATNPTAVRVARRFFHLPYHRARMTAVRRAGEVAYRSRRIASGEEVGFAARYRPTGPVFEARSGSLEHWLTERYCLFAERPDGTIRRGDVHHLPWPLQAGSAEIDSNTLLAPLGLPDPGPPALVHYAARLDVALWPLALA